MSGAGTVPRRVLLLGGTSEIGLAIVRRLARDGTVEPTLVGRSSERLEEALADLRSGAGCSGGSVAVLDALDTSAHERTIDDLFAVAGGFDLVVLAVGVLGAQEGLDADRRRALEVLEVNFVGAGSLLLASLRAMRARDAGTLVVLSSVAAERPRASNAVYGAAKAGFDALAAGLADSVTSTGVRVLVVRPGFVRTRMTAGLRPAAFATTAEAVADAVTAGLDRRAATIWVPPLLRYVFFVLRHLPRGVWRRLPL